MHLIYFLFNIPNTLKKGLLLFLFFKKFHYIISMYLLIELIVHSIINYRYLKRKYFV